MQRDLFNWVASWTADCCARGSALHVPAADVWIGWSGRCAHARDGLDGRALTPRGKLHWAGGRRLFDKLKGADVQAGHESDRFGFWAVEKLLAVRRPAKRRGRQLEARLRFAGRNPVTKEDWPDEWVPIALLKPDLKREARAMESRAIAAGAAPAGRVRKRSWAGLGWEGADEGLPRRGRSGRAQGGDPDGGNELVTVAAVAVPAGGPPAGRQLAMAYAWPRAAAWAYAVPAAGPPAGAAVVRVWPSPVVAVHAVPAAGPPEGTVTVWAQQLPDPAPAGAGVDVEGEGVAGG